MNRFAGLRRVLRLGAPRAELEEELAFHFDSSVQELIAAGRSRAEAEEEARRRFGDDRRWRRELDRIDRGAASRVARVERGRAALDVLRHAIRRITRSPGLAAAVVLTFGLGIGANATMFAIVDRLLLSPPPHIEQADGVWRLRPSQAGPEGPQLGSVISYPNLRDLSEASSFSVAAIATRTLTLGRGEGAREASATLVTGNFFSLLGTRPYLGRFFSPEEDRAGAAPVAVLGHAMWRGEFGGDPDVLGRTVDFGQGPVSIIGVAPPGSLGSTCSASTSGCRCTRCSR